LSLKTGRKREPEISRKARLEERQAAQVAGRDEGGTERPAIDASRRLDGRLGRRVSRRRKPEMDLRAGWKDLTADESRRLSWKAAPEDGSPMKVGGSS
jgi:hypothetical protein